MKLIYNDNIILIDPVDFNKGIEVLNNPLTSIKLFLDSNIQIYYYLIKRWCF